MPNHIGANVMWAVLRLFGLFSTSLLSRSKRRMFRISLCCRGHLLHLGSCHPAGRLHSWETQPICLSACALGLGFIAAIPLFIAVFKFSKSVIPVTAAICFSIALPWCIRIWTDSGAYYDFKQYSYSRSEPNLVATPWLRPARLHRLWGVRLASKLWSTWHFGLRHQRRLVLLSDIMDKLDRSLG